MPPASIISGGASIREIKSFFSLTQLPTTDNEAKKVVSETGNVC